MSWKYGSGKVLLRVYRLGPRGSSAILGVYEMFEEVMCTMLQEDRSMVDIGIPREYEEKFLEFCTSCGIEHRFIGESEVGI